MESRVLSACGQNEYEDRLTKQKQKTLSSKIGKQKIRQTTGELKLEMIRGNTD